MKFMNIKKRGIYLFDNIQYLKVKNSLTEWNIYFDSFNVSKKSISLKARSSIYKSALGLPKYN